MEPERKHYFSTRDLVMMAALAALGGVSGTAVNAIGDTLEAVLGFPGTFQFAAGLHVVWLVLAVGLTRRQGAGTITGILKGAVEFLSGNTHGVLILLIDLVAGVLVDLGMLPFRKKDSLLGYVFAGGLAACSNVFVFQAFASTPGQMLSLLWGIGGIAFLSGAVFAGLLGKALMSALVRSGAVKDRPAEGMPGRVYLVFLTVMVVLVAGTGVVLFNRLQGPPMVAVTGEVDDPYDYRAGLFDAVEIESDVMGTSQRYLGALLRDIVEKARPVANAASVLVTATDGYGFFISLDEVKANDRLILAERRVGQSLNYDIAGAENRKAWVRNVAEISVIMEAVIEMQGALERPYSYNAEEWQTEMDSALLDVGAGEKKYQGASLGNVLQRMLPLADASAVRLRSRSGEEIVLELSRVMEDEGVRIFTIGESAGITYAVAHEDGQIFLSGVTEIVVE
ncbi:MAG TPA: ECF transporter S component [Anaerolineae bacterium]|nr:ECF transporter S component [Anaerolineae bacterium]